jgi:hypothetical protein
VSGTVDGHGAAANGVPLGRLGLGARVAALALEVGGGSCIAALGLGDGQSFRISGRGVGIFFVFRRWSLFCVGVGAASRRGSQDGRPCHSIIVTKEVVYWYNKLF